MNIALLGYYGIGNLGDDTVVSILIENLRKRLRQVNFVAISLNPRESQIRHGIRAIPLRRLTKTAVEGSPGSRSKFERFLHTPVGLPFRLFLRVAPAEARFMAQSFLEMRSVDLLIIAGSGPLRDDETSAWHHPYSCFKWAMLSRMAGKRVLLLSVGAGPIRTRWGRFFVRNTVRSSSYRSFRSSYSRSLIAALGINEGLEFYPDQGFSLHIPDQMQESEKIHHDVIVGINPIAYFVHNRWIHTGEAVYRRYIQRMGDFIIWLLTQSYGILFFHTQIDGDEIASDDLIAYVRSKLGRKFNDKMTNNPAREINDILREISKVDVTICARFHGAVFSYMMKKPVLGVSVDSRIENLMEDMGLPVTAVHIDEFDLESIVRQFQSLIADSVHSKDQIEAKLLEYRRLLSDQYDHIVDRYVPASNSLSKIPLRKKLS